MEDMRGNTTNTEPSRVLRGLSASRGAASATALVLTAATPSASIVPGMAAGKVLVLPTAAILFAPALLGAAALVTDIGGSLSNLATIARELRVPCVMGVGAATTTIRSGDLVHVDATEARVQVLRVAAADIEREPVAAHRAG